MKYYKMPRLKIQSERRDKGKPKKRSPDDGGTTAAVSSEAAWTKRRRMSVEAAVAAAEADPGLQHLEDKVKWDDGDGFTVKQKALVQSQKRKYEARKVQAYLDGALVDAEVTTEIQEKAAKELQARKRRAKERAAKQNKVQAVTKKIAFDAKAVEGMKCFIHSEVDSPQLRQMLSQSQCAIATDRASADMFIAEDPSSIGCRSTWVAVLKGSFVMTPAALNGDGRGAVLKYKSALGVRRMVHITSQFAEHHPEVTKILFDVSNSASPKSQWKFVASAEDRLNPQHAAPQLPSSVPQSCILQISPCCRAPAHSETHQPSCPVPALVGAVSNPAVMHSSSHAFQQPFNPAVMQSSNHGIQQSCNPAVMQSSSHTIQQSCNPTVRQSSSHAIQQSYNPTVIQSSNHAIQQPRQPAICNPCPAESPQPL